MNIIVNGGGRVVMWSENASPTPNAGQRLVVLTGPFRDTFLVLINQPNSGLQYDDTLGPTSIPFVAPILPDLSNFATLTKQQQAVGLMIAGLLGKTPAEIKAAFAIAYNSLS